MAIFGERLYHKSINQSKIACELLHIKFKFLLTFKVHIAERLLDLQTSRN